jgi:hypothetical protein
MNEIKEINIERLLHDTPSIKVGYNSDIKTVFLIMNGFLKYDQFVTASEILVKAIEKYKPENLVSDLRKAKVLSTDIQKYNNENLAVFLKSSSIKRNPLLVSEDVFLKFTINAMEKKLKTDFSFEVKHFVEYEQVLHWINENA